MRYFKIESDGRHNNDWGGYPVDWIEVNENGIVEREINEYPNGNALSYDGGHVEDDDGALTTDDIVIDDFWTHLEITKEEFERKWKSISPVNRENRF